MNWLSARVGRLNYLYFSGTNDEWVLQSGPYMCSEVSAKDFFDPILI